MISEHISRIEGIAIYPIISLIIFSVLFIITIVWVLKLDKKYVARMENLPLDSNSELSPNEINFQNNSETKNEIEK